MYLLLTCCPVPLFFVSLSSLHHLFKVMLPVSLLPAWLLLSTACKPFLINPWIVPYLYLLWVVLLLPALQMVTLSPWRNKGSSCVTLLLCYKHLIERRSMWRVSVQRLWHWRPTVVSFNHDNNPLNLTKPWLLRSQIRKCSHESFLWQKWCLLWKAKTKNASFRYKK